MVWRETNLLDSRYPGLSSMSGRTLLADDCIEKLATCGEIIEDYTQLRRHIRWVLGEADNGNGPSDLGRLLLAKLAELYQELEREQRKGHEVSYMRKFRGTLKISR